MTSAERANYRERLEQLMRQLNQNLPQLQEEAHRAVNGETSGGISNQPLHLADLAARETEEQVTMGLLQNTAWSMVEIADAVARLDEGTFGRCERCGQEIPSARLAVHPYARFCLPCAEQAERETRR